MLKAADAMQESTVLCIDPLPASAPITNESDAENATRRAFGAVRGWRTPPNWSLYDWHHEARAIIAAASCRAAFDYDPKRGVPRAAFVYKRAVASVWTRYRQEWAYGLRFASAPPKTAEQPASAPHCPNESVGTMDRRLCEALDLLPSIDQWLIRQLFWSKACERRVAVTLHVSQQEVSRRKARVLRSLRRTLNYHSRLSSNFLTFWWVLLDGLDLLPGINFL